jgi:voltage-gated potassium channel
MNQPAPKTLQRRFFVALGHAIHVTWPVLSAILAIQLALGLLTGFVEGWSLGDAVYFALLPASRLVTAISSRGRR